MTLTNGYCSVLELKARLLESNLDLQSDTTNDSQFESIIEAASRWIDGDRMREFYATTATRCFTAITPSRCKIDDLISLTSLKTDSADDGTFETTWETTDYKLFPLNGGCYTEINTRLSSRYEFPLYDGAVQVTGSFGYSATAPKSIKEACILISMRVWSRKDLLFGIAGNSDLGTTQVITSIAKDGEIRGLLDAIPKRVV